MSSYANPLTDYSPQMEFSGGSGGRHHHRKYPNPQVLTDGQEMELAAEFLEVADDEELEQFLGDLIGGIGSALGKIVNSPVGKAVGGVLKDVAKTALPIAGGALGDIRRRTDRWNDRQQPGFNRRQRARSGAGRA